MSGTELYSLHRFLQRFTEVPLDQAFGELRVELIKAVIENGANSQEANARTNEYLGLLHRMALEANRKCVDIERRFGVGWRARHALIEICRVRDLKRRAVVVRHARSAAVAIRDMDAAIMRIRETERPAWVVWEDGANRLCWTNAAAKYTTALFDRIATNGKGGADSAEIDALVIMLSRLAGSADKATKTIGGRRRGRPKNKDLDFLIDQLAEKYGRDTGKLPHGGVYKVAGRYRGDFFELVDKEAKGLRHRPPTRDALGKAVTRFLLRSLRVPVERDHGFRWKMITQSGAT